MKTIRSSNPNDLSYNKQVDGRTRLKEMESVCVENWKGEIYFTKIAKQLKN